MIALSLNQSQGISYEVTQSFESISLNSQSSWWYHQASTTPSSSSIIPTRNSSSGYTTSIVHRSPFGGVNQWGMFVATPAFTPSPYIALQVMTSTPIYTMEVNSSFGRVEKFNRRQMYTTLALTQSAYSYGDVTTWHPDQVHLPIFNTLHFTLNVGGEGGTM
jgi:hypothetical protein